jgi:hypothetical protein
VFVTALLVCATAAFLPPAVLSRRKPEQFFQGNNLEKPAPSSADISLWARQWFT